MSRSSHTSIRPRADLPRPFRAALAALLVLSVVACAQLALIPWTPLLSIALASRGDDHRDVEVIADLQKKEDWRGLSQLAQQHVAKDPNRSNWWIVLGYAQMRLGEQAQAIEAFSRAVQWAPEDIDGWNMLGEAQRLAKKPEVAIQTLDRASSIDPRSPVTRYLLGQAYSDTGRHLRAAEAYRASLQLEPGFAEAWFGLGYSLVQLGEKKDVPPIIAKLKELNPALAGELTRILSGNK